MANPLEKAGFVTVNNDYSKPKTLARVRKALTDGASKEDGGDCESITLPWWVWDDVFANLPKDLGHAVYPENGPLANVKYLISKGR